MTVTCNYRSTAVIILPGVYLPPQRNATVADDAFSLLFISIHAPREGSNKRCSVTRLRRCRFQSTLPARGATPRMPRGTCRTIYFNPRSPRGERPNTATQIATQADFNPRSPRGERRASCDSSPGPRPISIHAPREGSDGSTRPMFFAPAPFQSTLPARGATVMLILYIVVMGYFNPRSPRGERLLPAGKPSGRKNNFNPRSPRGERPVNHAGGKIKSTISIHAPREGSDCFANTYKKLCNHFNPRSPRGERRLPYLYCLQV